MDDDFEFYGYQCVGCKLRHHSDERRTLPGISATLCPRCDCLGFTKFTVKFEAGEVKNG